MTQTQMSPTDTELLATAAQLSDAFSDRAAEFDQARRLSQDASDAMARAGFYQLFVPEYLGGLEASPLVEFQRFFRATRSGQCGLRLGCLYRRHEWVDAGQHSSGHGASYL